ncbi:MAG: protein kinase [Deltaproteobacteria bacterium]|nr:protein kinase [Deltaproteobacteria bacterium]
MEEAAAAEAGGDLLRAHRCLLAAGRWRPAAELRARILQDAPADEDARLARALAGQCRARGRKHEAALLFERLGELDTAAALHRQAGHRLEAARALCAAGSPEEARALLTEWVEESRRADLALPPAAALLLLARLCLSGPDPLAAARHAQTVEEGVGEGEERRAALGLLVVAFHRAGLPAAAEEALQRLREADPGAPATPEAVLQDLALGHETTDEGEGERWVLSRYRLERLLGAGAMGQVYRAIDALTGETVAVKILAPSSLRGAGGAEDRFYREARIAQTIDDPGLVRVRHAQPEEGILVMEFLPGGTLADRLRGGRHLPWPVVVRLGVEAARALAAAHRRGVLHRDVKPANLLFDALGSVHLGDFGAAHLVSFQQTGTGYLLGTLAFMAPEQLEAAALDGRTDLYALAVTLYRAATGHLPFPGPQVAAQQRAGARPPSTLQPQLEGQAIDAFFERALAHDRADRFESGEAFARALGALAELGGGAEAAPAPTPAGAPAEDSARPGPRFDFETALGQRVHLARDARLGRRVVVETLPGDISPATLARLRELAAAGNPHLQPLLDLLPEESLAIYHLVEGLTLEEELSRPGGAPGRDRRLRLAADVARALRDHPGPLRPGRIRIVGGRAILLLAGIEALHAGAEPPADARPAVARVERWLALGADPGELSPEVAAGHLAALREPDAPEAPAEAEALSRWLDAGRAGG